MKSKQTLKRVRRQGGRKRTERLGKSKGHTALQVLKPTECFPVPSCASKVLQKAKHLRTFFLSLMFSIT